MHSISHILLGLTAMERWAGTRRMSPRSDPHDWFVVIGAVVMVTLLVLLVALSFRRRRLRQGQKVETFADNARRRGLSARERQILLAVALRGGLENTYDVFRESGAFHDGTARLLAECAQARTPQEVEALNAELSRLGQKLGFRKAVDSLSGPTARGSNRRRFPRVAVRWPALVAHWPLVRRGAGAEEAAPSDAAGSGAADTSLTAYVPAFVDSTVTELAGPGLRIETRLQTQVDDRILVIFPLAEGIGGTRTGPRIVAAVGRVKHGRDLEHGARIPDAIDQVWNGSPPRDFRALAARLLSMAVELTDLDEEEIEELVSVTKALSARVQDARGAGATGSGAPATRVARAPVEPPVATGAERDE